MSTSNIPKALRDHRNVPAHFKSVISIDAFPRVFADFVGQDHFFPSSTWALHNMAPMKRGRPARMYDDESDEEETDNRRESVRLGHQVRG